MMSSARLDKLIWQLIFGGCIGVGVGLFSHSRLPVFSSWLMVLGGLAIGAGAVLIWVRSRRPG